MELTIDIDRWRNALGPTVMLMAYFEASNRRDWETWHRLVADDATHTANITSAGLTVRKLKTTVLEGIIDVMPDVFTEVRNVRPLSDTSAIAEWHTEGTMRSGKRYVNDGFIRFDLDAEGLVRNVTVAEFSIDAIDGMREAGFDVALAD